MLLPFHLHLCLEQLLISERGGMSSVKRGGHALRGPAEPHLRFPGYRRIGEQRQIPATVFHPGHAAG